MFTATLGWLAAALSMTLLWPQVWLSCVRRRTSGMSAVSAWLGVAMPAGWVTYGSLAGDGIQMVTNTVTGTAGAALLIALLVTRPELRTARRLLPGAAGAAALLLAAAGAAAGTLLPGVDGADTAPLLGGALTLTSFVSAVPQPLALLRDRGQDLAGLSAPRWWMAAAACTLWAAYGLCTGQPAVWSSAAVGLAGALVVCTVLARGPRPAPAAAPAPVLIPVRVPVVLPRPVRGTARVVAVADMPTAVLTLPARPHPARPRRVLAAA